MLELSTEPQLLIVVVSAAGTTRHAILRPFTFAGVEQLVRQHRNFSTTDLLLGLKASDFLLSWCRIFECVFL